MKIVKVIWRAAWIMPWLTLVSGIPAIVCFRRSSQLWRDRQLAAYETANRLFHAFSAMTGIIGFTVILAELAVMLLGLAMLVKRRRTSPEERSSAGRYWGMLLTCPLFMAGTLLLMILVRTLTYGMGV